MAKRIKIHIDTPDRKIHLPSVGRTMAITFIRVGLWGSGFAKDMQPETREWIRDNKELIVDAVRNVFKILQDYEPFVLVEVESKDTHVLIEVM
jgi:hypothetical protein